MTTENTIPKVKRTNPRLNHTQFFQLCEMMRNKREVLQKLQPSFPEAAKQLSEWLKFYVAPGTVQEASEATKVVWETRVKRAGQEQMVRKVRMRVLGKAIVVLFRKLGEAPPEDLLEMMQEMYGEGHLPVVCRRDYSNVSAGNGQAQ